ncbi:MAG: protein kinase [Gemmataceae bacterium]|nr:protein kinase [Gemmataceae bacterium]
MAIASSNDLVETLGPFLQPAQLDEARNHLQTKLGNAQALAQELVRRGWLTLFQARLLVNGRAADLLLGPYVILDRLGSGGGGQVFKAWHQQMKKVVALKVLRPDAAKDKEVVQRFHREMEVASQISHPNIVYAYEAGPIGNQLVLALEYVEGTTLEELVAKSGPLPLARACEYIRQAAVGMQYAHERGLIHRDIKPANLLVAGTRNQESGIRSQESAGRSAGACIKLLDLGLARLGEMAGSSTANLTVAGGQSVMQGTPDYMAPEQALDFHTADIRADIYSLGCTFFFLLTGHPPFGGGTLAQKLMKHQTAAAPLDTIRPPLLPGVDRVMRRMLAKEPKERFQTPGEVVQALQPFCPPSTRVDLSSDTLNVNLDGSTFLGPKPGASRSRLIAPSASHRSVQRLWLALVALALAMGVALVVMVAVGLSGSPESSTAAQTVTPTPPDPGPGKVGSYRERFQGPTPAPGWQYLGNTKGPIGNPAHYQPLTWWVGGQYNGDGKGPLPRPDPAGFASLAKDSGHPGRGANQGSKWDVFALAAYTIQPGDGSGHYRIGNTSLRRGNGLELIVHLGGRSPLFLGKVPKDANPPASFDANVGFLSPGDTIYVGVGPDKDDGSDSFTDFDFTVMRESGPTLPVGRKTVIFKEGFESSSTGWLTRSTARFGTTTEQPREGKQAFQIIVAPGEPLAYQQINRVVEENPQPGDVYTFTTWVRTKDATGTGAYGYVQFLGDKENQLFLQHTRVHIKNGSKGWEQLSASVPAPPGTKRVRVGCVMHATGTAWFDDVEVIRETRGQP